MEEVACTVWNGVIFTVSYNVRSATDKTVQNTVSLNMENIVKHSIWHQVWLPISIQLRAECGLEVF